MAEPLRETLSKVRKRTLADVSEKVAEGKASGALSVLKIGTRKLLVDREHAEEYAAATTKAEKLAVVDKIDAKRKAVNASIQAHIKETAHPSMGTKVLKIDFGVADISAARVAIKRMKE